MTQPDNGFRKKNVCPYCGYNTNRAQMIEDDNAVPEPEDLSFCLMCCEYSQFDTDFNLIEFDLNSITDSVERNRLKINKIKMESFWEKNPDKTGRRDKYLKELDRRLQTKTP